ncbi:MAG: tripartite tricarboxylate transporter permease, partial [Natronospirillum sp.]
MESILSALSMVGTFPVITSIIVGTVIGVIVGVLPGLGPALAVSLVLPFTFTMESISSIAVLLGVYGGSIYGGSITAILLNTPGTPASAATCIDGYPMARKGQADLAIGVATVSSFIGGVLSLVALFIAAPMLASLALEFGPSEMFALAVFALTCIAAVSRGAMVKGLLAGCLGIFFSFVGQDTLLGSERFTFGVF